MASIQRCVQELFSADSIPRILGESFLETRELFLPPATTDYYAEGLQSSPEDELIAKESFANCLKQLERISPTQAAIARLLFLDELPLPQVAKRVGMNFGAVEMFADTAVVSLDRIIRQRPR